MPQFSRSTMEKPMYLWPFGKKGQKILRKKSADSILSPNTILLFSSTIFSKSCSTSLNCLLASTKKEKKSEEGYTPGILENTMHVVSAINSELYQNGIK